MNIMPLLTISLSDLGAIVGISVAVLTSIITVSTALIIVSRWSGRVDAKIDGIDGRFNKVEKDISRIETLINSVLGLLPAKPISESKSPVELNELGNKIFANINGDNLVKNHIDFIEHNDEMNAYQIQQLCFDYAQAELMEKISDEERGTLQKAAFDAGLPIQSILRILGIELRNAKLNALNMNPAAIDSQDPQK